MPVLESLHKAQRRVQLLEEVYQKLKYVLGKRSPALNTLGDAIAWLSCDLRQAEEEYLKESQEDLARVQKEVGLTLEALLEKRE